MCESKDSTNARVSQKQSVSHSFPTSIGIKDNENDINDYDDSDQSFLPKPSPPEVVDVSDEQLSPVCDYSDYMRPDNQVKVGVSPTDEMLDSPQHRAYEEKQTQESVVIEEKSKTEVLSSSSESHSAYENNAFAGTENIDKPSNESDIRSPYEVVRHSPEESQDKFDNQNRFAFPEGVPKNENKKSDHKKDGDDKEGDNLVKISVETIDKELEGKVKKQIVSEIFTKELNEEVMNGSPERKIIKSIGKQNETKSITETKQITDLDETDFEEIRREAQIIAQNIVVKAKEELAKIPHKINISSEISDEDLVEQEWDDLEDINRVTLDSVSPIVNDSEPSPVSPDTAKAQKRISFTENETLFLKTVEKSSLVLEKNISPEELKRTLSQPRKSIDSGSRSGSQKEKESGSSSDSHYQSCHSFDVSDSSKTPGTSRPTSSEFDLAIIPEHHLSSRSSGGFGLSASEYETCGTSQEGSYATAATSQETSYHTAHTSMCEGSSRNSTISIESESSGHLGEMSSEGSETVVTEEDRDKRSSSDDDYDQNGSVTPVNELKEPFDCEIPESVIRSGIEIPFMSGTNWESLEVTQPKAIFSTSLEGLPTEEVELFTDSLKSSQMNTLTLVSNNSIDESEQNSENSNTWHSSSIGTAINTGQPNSGQCSLTSLGQSGCAESAQMPSLSESLISLETLNNNELQQSSQTIDSVQYSNGPVEVDYNPDYDVSEIDRRSIQSATAEHLSSTQDSSSDHTSEHHLSDTPLVSQSSFCSSVLSEHTRHQLSYDLSPDLHLGVSDSPTTGSDDFQRPQSPVPPEAEELIFLETTQEKSPIIEKSSFTPEVTHSIEPHTELYTHQEVDEDIEDSPSRKSLSSRLGQSKPIAISASRSGESSAASSLKEFERLESEMKAKGSLHGSSDSLGSSLGSGRPVAGRGSDRDDHSVSSSINEFEKLEKDCSEAERIEREAQEEAARLSEIEEGHESQASDASQETLSGNDASEDTDSDYEKRMSEIDDMMKLAQNKVEKMQTISKSFESCQTSDTTPDKGSTDNSKEKMRTQSQSSAQLILTRKVVSTDSADLISSISTTNTESLIDRIDDLIESKDDNKSMSSDSMHEEFKDEFIQELEFQSEGLNENISAKSSLIDSVSSSVPDTTAILSFDSGPALATLREEIDFEEDSLKESFHGILKPSECMLSSTDSLETNTAGTHATYHCGSAMSSSYVTSGDEATMVSSTETADLLFNRTPEPLDIDQQNRQLRQLFENERINSEPNKSSSESNTKSDDNNDNQSNEEFEEFQTQDERGNYKVFRRVKRSVPTQQTTTASSSSENEERFLEMLRKSAQPGNEVIEEERAFDESGNIVIRRIVKTSVTQGPDLTSKLVSGQSAERVTEEFLDQFTKLAPVTNVDEYEGFDESGNPFKVLQEVTVTPEVRAVTFSGPDAQQKMDQFLKDWSGDKEELIEVNKPNPSETNPESNISDSNNREDTEKGRDHSTH